MKLCAQWQNFNWIFWKIVVIKLRNYCNILFNVNKTLMFKVSYYTKLITLKFHITLYTFKIFPAGK